ncbi:hypothetical protein BGZ97_006302, partial [Linnemannia gamsii]
MDLYSHSTLDQVFVLAEERNVSKNYNHKKFFIELGDVENCTSRAMYEFEELTDNDDDDGGEADEHNEDNNGAERATHRESRQLGYNDILSKLGRDNVASVYSVKLTKKKHQQLLFHLQDRGYFCTCLRLQKMGIVCRHCFAFFRQHQLPLRYHLNLIPHRWYQEKYQSQKDLKTDDRAFIGYVVHDATDTPGNEYMSCVWNLSMADAPSPSAKLCEIDANVKRYELTKDIAWFLRTQPMRTEDDYTRIKTHLNSA